MNERPSVIVADNSEAYLMYMSILLQRLDFEVLPVNNGLNALKMAKAVQPNLIILSMSIAGMNGLEALSAMRDDEDLASTPVIIAGDNPADEEPCRQQGCQAFLTKPIDLDPLHKALETCRSDQSYQRQSLRAPYSEKVTLNFNFKDYHCQAITLSEGGVFIRRRLPLPQGCLLEVSLPLGDDATLQLEGEVIYTKQLTEDRFTMPPGMAIRFLEVDADKAELLRNYIKELLIGDLVEEQDELVIKS